MGDKDALEKLIKADNPMKCKGIGKKV